MDLGRLLHVVTLSWTSVAMLLGHFTYVALAGCGWLDIVSPSAIADRGLELLSTTLIFNVLVTNLLYMFGCQFRDQSSSLKPHVTRNLI